MSEKMLLVAGKYYHLYNLSNEEKIIFKEEKNYLFFLERYQLYLGELVSTLAYCLLPADFHFIIKVLTVDNDVLEKNLTTFLNGYAKAMNNGFAQNGNSLQVRIKAKEIGDEDQVLPLVTYVHQLPVTAQLATRMEEWHYSSYADLIGMRNGTIASSKFIRQNFFSVEDFQKYSEGMLDNLQRKEWM